MKELGKRRILLVPLDWGLGHATRLVPLIEEAVRCGDLVWIGGNGRSGEWLKERFLNLPFEAAPEWTLRHSGNLAWDLVKDWRSFRRSLREDRQWATEIAKRLQLTHMVSDHRLGLRAQGPGGSSVHHVLVMHQLTMALPLLWRWPPIMQRVSLILWAMLRPFWSSFQEIWIPDSGHRGTALAPHLSIFPWVKDGWQWSVNRDKAARSPRFRYLGWRSRFEAMLPNTTAGTGEAMLPGITDNIEDDLPEGSAILVVLSGPEPARSRLEARVIAQWKAWVSIHKGLQSPKGTQSPEGAHSPGGEDQERPMALWLVRGVPAYHGRVEGILSTKDLRVWNSPDDQTMYSLLTRAEWIVGRAGYSSLMDYACLRSLVSDPQPLRFCAVHAHGHSEQGYLGQRLKRLGYADFRSENTFDLREAWLDRNRFKFAYAFPE
jgi:hypothetical protein